MSIYYNEVNKTKKGENMEKYYTVFDIISGLRPEYLKTKKQLELLKNYLELEKNMDINFFIRTQEIQEPCMLYYLYRTDLLGNLSNGEGKLKRIIPHHAPEKLIKINNIYSIPDKHVLIKDEKEFSNEIKKILNSDFVQEIEFERSIEDYKIEIHASYMTFKKGNNSITYTIDDKLKSHNSELDILNYEISELMLPEYHADKIEETKILKKKF